MGVVDFDPEKWSRANASEAAPPVANLANLANPSRTFTEHSQHSQDSQVLALPADVRDGVAILRKMNAPRRIPVEGWARVVGDAVSLVECGWAAKALALGWSQIGIFGAVTDPAGDPYSDGLAVWLGGRRVLAVTATCATVEDVGGRAYYNRREQVGAKLLWEIR